jgi:hypothetical protein
MQIMKNHIKLDQELPELKAKNVDGKRFYEKQDGSRYPSITSVLSIKNNEGICFYKSCKSWNICSQHGRRLFK